MTIADRWLLPDGVEEILPQEAYRIEMLRRRLLDLYSGWGYELVIPPLIEFSESLLIGLGSDMDLQTFKVVDQLTGRTLAIRADITPQTARMDAHSLHREDPLRLCYSGTVLHTRPKNQLSSRTPIEVGAELYGSVGMDADCEVILLMLETLHAAGADKVHLDIGHVAIYRELLKAAQLDVNFEELLFSALQRKAINEVDQLIDEGVGDKRLAAMLHQLVRLNGDVSVLDSARKSLAGAPATVLAALDELSQLADRIARQQPAVTLYFDLTELRGYHYHTGLVFAAFIPGYGQALANGGRYDNVGAVFGRGRPATGFSADLKVLAGLGGQEVEAKRSIVVWPDSDERCWQAIQRLRDAGERVVCALAGQTTVPGCDRILVKKDNEWQVQPVSVENSKD